MDPLFPALPKDISEKSLDDKALADLLAEHEVAAGLIDADDAEFLADRSADEIIEEYVAGADQILALKAEVQAREEAHANYVERKAELSAKVKGDTVEAVAEAAEENGGDEENGDEAEPEEEAKAEEVVEADSEEAPAEKELALVADAEVPAEEPKRLRRAVPTPAADRIAVEEPKKALSFVASGMLPSTPPGQPLETMDAVAAAMLSLQKSVEPPVHREGGREERFRVASLDYSENFPEERRLNKSDWIANSKKIADVGSPYFGNRGLEAFVASGGLCAPLEPIYSMPNLATDATPAWDSLPHFRAERGGVNVPTPTTIGDADGAITTITEAEDALGGTFALKDCLDLTCPEYTETAVTIVSACREFGNLNAMAWPEKIAHELEITRALHARTVEELVLDRLKALSVNVTNGAETLGALIFIVDAITKSAFGIRSRLRMPLSTRFQAIMPANVLDQLLLDTVQNQFDRYRTRGDIAAYLASCGIDVTWYLDTPTTGDSQIADTAQTATTLDLFPDTVQWAIFPQGTFLGIDMADLNLGLVRDSTLNSTNDFQYFWESFLNVARIGPAQAAYWVTTNICPQGTFPAAGTTVTCT